MAILDGRRILVTGGAGGIGVAAVRALAAEGARVLATHHHTAPPAVPGAEWVRCDVTDSADVADLFAATGDRFGGLDVLVHTAGAWLPGIPGQIEMSDLDTVMTTNFTSTVLTNQAAFALMRETGGQIINFGSAEAVMGSPLAAGYSAAKAAVAAWTRSIARAWAPHRVTANALAPAVDTPGAQRLREFLGPGALPFLEQQLQHSIPLGGALGDPLRDIGPVLVFLSSSGAGFVTGQLIAVDGGLTMLGS